MMAEPTPPTPTPEPPVPEPPTPAGSPWDGLPPDLKDNPAISGHTDLESLAREHINAQSLIGKKGIIPPGENATPEEVSEFQVKLGKPEKAENYDFEGLTVPEGLPWDDGFALQMIDSMHRNGLTQAQLKGVLSDYMERQGTTWNEMQGTLQSNYEETVRDFQKRWGKAYQANVDLAQRAFDTIFGDKAEEAGEIRMADGMPLRNHPMLVEALAAHGQRMAEHQLVGPKSGAARTTRTPEEAEAEWNRLRADDEGFMAALMNGDHPEHDAALLKKKHLFEEMDPEGANEVILEVG
jgi:hypothetical protein